jgi:outer membrane protein
MKKIITLFSMLALFALPAVAEVKIAVIDMQLVMNGTEAAKNTQDELKKESEKANKRFTEMEESFKERVEDLRRKKGVLSEEKYLEEEAVLRKLYRDQQSEVQSVNEKLSREYKRVQKQISDEVDEIVSDIAKEKGYDAVMRRSYLVYGSKSIDITKQVLARVDKVLDKKMSSKGL